MSRYRCKICGTMLSTGDPDDLLNHVEDHVNRSPMTNFYWDKVVDLNFRELSA